MTQARKKAVARKPRPRNGVAWRARLAAALPWTLAAVSLAGVLAGVIYMPRMLSAWPLEEVSVTGVSDARRQEAVRVSLSELLADENFFSVPLERIHDRVTDLAWVSGASVRRRWPDRLVLDVTERVPVAVWNEDTLVSSSGEAFSAVEQYATEGLPRLSGPEDRLDEVMNYYHGITKMLDELDPDIRVMAVDERLTARLELDSGAKLIVDRDGYTAKLRRFVRFYQEVARPVERRLARVDLRYGNGLAVRWRDEDTDPAPEERV